MAMKIRHIKGFKYVFVHCTCHPTALVFRVSSAAGGIKHLRLRTQSQELDQRAAVINACSGKVSQGLHAHPSIPGQFYYVVGSSVLAVFEVRAIAAACLRTSCK